MMTQREFDTLTDFKPTEAEERLWKEREQLLAELEQYKAAANTSVCAWCGWIGPRTAEAIYDHQMACEKRKGFLEDENKALRRRNEQLEQAFLQFAEAFQRSLVAIKDSLEPEEG